MTPRRWLAVAVVGLALLLVGARLGAALYVDHAWHAALGAGSLWRAKIAYTLLLRGLTATAGGVFVFVNLYYVRHSIVSLVLPRRVGDLEIGEEVPGRYLMGAVFLLSLALGALLTIPYGEWTLLAQAWRGLPFGEGDPHHSIDLGFYVHWLPLEVALYHWALLVLLVVVLVVVALYALTPSLRWAQGQVRVTTYVRRHLVALGAVALLLLAWSYRLDQFRLLVEGSGPQGLFTYADHKVRLTANAFLVLFTGVIAAFVLVTGWTGHVRRAFIGVTLVLLLSVTLRQALPAIAVRMQGAADPVQRERPYERTRDSFTRRAVGLETLGPDDSAPRFASLAELARGTPAWDGRALARALARRAGAGVRVGDPAWREEAGVPVMAVVERPATEGEPSTGWSVVSARGDLADPLAALVGDANGRGAPVRVVAPPVAYPGARGYAIVEDAAARVPSPGLRTLPARLAHAWGEQNLRFLDAGLGDPGVRLVLRRDVRERLRQLYPFFEQGGAVVPIVAGRTLYWAVHLYSASEWYPLAGPVEVAGRDWRSWRHAAVALVEAETGRVHAIPDPARDRLADGWVRMFPALFASPAALPADVLAQLPPAEEAAHAQASALARAGLKREAAPPGRRVVEAMGDTLVAAQATPFVAPGGGLAVAIPLVGPTDRLAGLLVARGGMAGGTAWAPLDSGAPRVAEARERLQRAVDSSGARDGRDAAGALRAVPVAARGGAALLLSRYRWRGEAPPELAQVAVATGDTVVAARTLLETAAGPPGVAPAPAPP